MDNDSVIDKKKKYIFLIILCWVIYVASYIGKLGYTANIIQVEKYFNISHTSAGLVSTIFFFSYGIGQVLNGIISKKLNIKYTIFICLLVSTICNLIVGLTNSFNLIKIVWLFNGISLSTCWPLLVRLLSSTLDEKYFPVSVIVMGTTVASGTILVYGLSALFVYFGNFKIIFYLASILLPLIAFIWFFSYNHLTTTTNNNQNDVKKEETLSHNKFDKAFIIVIALFVLFAMMTNLIKDGLTTWLPLIIKEKFSLDDSLSILITLILPIISIFGTYFVVMLNKKVKDFISLMTINYLITFVLLLLVCLFNNMPLIPMIIIFALVSLTMAGVNNIVTSMAPIYMKDKLNSGMFAGIMNGCCYLGSMLSSYGLGYIADKYDFNMVFKVLTFISIIIILLASIYLIVSNIKKKLKTNN